MSQHNSDVRNEANEQLKHLEQRALEVIVRSDESSAEGSVSKIPAPPGADEDVTATTLGAEDDEVSRKAVLAGFSVCSASETGSDHLSGQHAGKGNQDACGHAIRKYGIAVVVSDGCGSAPDSKTGSSVAVRIALKVAAQLLSSPKLPATPSLFAQQLEDELLARIRTLAETISVGDAPDKVLYQSFLFTTQIGVITPLWSAVIGCGDGYVGMNGNIQELLPRMGNQPDYLSYRLFSEEVSGFENLSLKVLREVDTLDLTSLFVATDGVGPVAQARKRGFTLSDLWTDGKYLNADEAQRTFELLGKDREVVVTDRLSGTQKVRREKGLFTDDATLVVVIRKPDSALPASWIEYRQTYGAEAPIETGDAIREHTEGRERTSSTIPLPEQDQESDRVVAFSMPESTPAHLDPLKVDLAVIDQLPMRNYLQAEYGHPSHLTSQHAPKPRWFRAASERRNFFHSLWAFLVWLFFTPIRFPHLTGLNPLSRRNIRGHKRRARSNDTSSFLKSNRKEGR